MNLMRFCLERLLSAWQPQITRSGQVSQPSIGTHETLCSKLTYKQGRPEVLTGTHVSAYTTRYAPPFAEFEVDHVVVPEGASIEFENLGPSIFLVFERIGAIVQSGTQVAFTSVTKGDVFFVSAAQTIEIAATVEVMQVDRELANM